MREACSLVWSVLVLLFQSRASLDARPGRVSLIGWAGTV